MAVTDGNRRLLALLDEASRDLGLGAVAAVNPRQAGAADVSFVATKVTMAVDGLGLKGAGGHTVQETADLALLAPQAKRVAVLLARLAEGRR
jgi:glutamate carboxypeptidase